MNASLCESCVATVVERRKSRSADGLPPIFGVKERRIVRESPDTCGGRYARYFKRAPDPVGKDVPICDKNG